MKQFRRIKELTSLAIQAADGAVGKIQELYFDDRRWAVRYLVVNTGGWLLGRDVLIAPVAVEAIDDTDGILRLRLTKEQIEHAPPVDRAKPISRQYEEAYYRHFRWAPYWQPGPTEWGNPVLYPSTPLMDLDRPPFTESPEEPHLRSSKEIAGYRIHAQDGEIGHVEDLVVDDEEWVVRYAEVDTRNWLP